MTTTPRIAIIIPTINRPHFIIRGIRYYASVKAPCTIYIGNSGSDEEFDLIEAAIEKEKGRLKVIHNRYPDLNGPLCIKEMCRVCEEPYAAFSGDDDFLIPATLVKAAEFLENNPDYRAANGRGLIFELDSNSVYGNVTGTSPYRLENLQEDSGAKRLLSFLANYWVPLFSLHRTEELYQDHANLENLTEISFTEVLSNSLTAVRGKIELIPGLHTARQTHSTRLAVAKFFKKITRDDWGHCCHILIDTLSEALQETDGITSEAAKEIASTAFESYLMRIAGKEVKTLEAHNGNGHPKLTKVSNGINRIKNRLFTDQSMRKSNLLKPNSPYYHEFAPLYKILTQKDPINY